jgi:hypothetical protein
MNGSSLWSTYDFPILRAIAERNNAGTKPDAQILCDVTGLEPDVVRGSLERLYEGGFIQGGASAMLGGNGGTFDMSNISLREKGLRAVEEWPAEAGFEQFVESLREAIASEGDTGRRTGLQRVLEAVEAAGVAALGAVLAAYFRRMVG